jgi:hypothetical protein
MYGPIPYQIRVLPRARTVRLRICPLRGLEVLVPRGYDCRRIPHLLEAHGPWLDRAFADAARKRAILPAGHGDPLPARLDLRALEERWQVEYCPLSRVRGAQERISHRLLIGADDPAAHRAALRAWLKAYTRHRLIPLLEAESQRLALPYRQAAVRGQRTRWASCSARGTISLNYKMLFLPSGTVRYLFVHELCHTRYLNHAARFWHLVEQLMPDYREAERRLAESWRYVPLWVEME